MPVTALAALLLLTASQKATHAPSVRELGGLMLGQSATSVEKKLGKPIDTDVNEEDGEPLWYFALAPTGAEPMEATTILTVSISKSEPKTVTGIIVSGEPKEGLVGIHGLTLGSSKEDVLKRLGTPDTTEPRENSEESADGEMLDWEDRNYYVELDRDGKVDWIEVSGDDYGYAASTASKPDLAGFQKALAARDREAVLDWICADLTIDTKSDGRVGFVASPRDDLFDETSLVARYLYGGAGSLREGLTADLARTPLVERKTDEGTVHWAHRFPKGAPIAEIVWWYEAGRWRVWHIDFELEGTTSR